jgi:hypothetical protein
MSSWDGAESDGTYWVRDDVMSLGINTIPNCNKGDDVDPNQD